MSVLGAVVDYFKTATTTEAIALRDALTAMYADKVPPTFQEPYCVISEIGSPQAGGSIHSTRLQRIVNSNVVFTVFGKTRAEVETVLELLDDCYLSDEAGLTIANREHISTTYSDRQSLYDSQGWTGNLQVVIKNGKAGA